MTGHGERRSGAAARLSSADTEVLTISQAAKRAGWSRRRMYRFLMAQHRKLGGLLVDVSSNRRPMWTVSLGALRSIAPEWAADPERVSADLEYLREHAANTDERLASHEDELKCLRGQIAMLVDRVAKERRRTG